MKDHKDFLIDQLKLGSEKAYHYLFSHYYARLCRVANTYLNDSFAAENIVSDLFFYLWEHREEISINSSLDSYLLKSVRNRCLNYLQQAMYRYETDLPDSISDFSVNHQNDSTPGSPLDHLLEKELEGKIHMAVGNLPDECRAVFKMSRYEQNSYEEIAQSLGISVNTVRYHMKNALSRLRENLKDYLTFFLW